MNLQETQKPNIAVALIGTYDVVEYHDNQSGSALDFFRDYIDFIDEINDREIDYCVVCTMPSLINDPAYLASNTLLGTMNSEINVLAGFVNNSSRNIKIILVDVFTLLGGNSPNVDDFQAGSFLFSEQGSQKVGKAIGDAIHSIIASDDE